MHGSTVCFLSRRQHHSTCRPTLKPDPESGSPPPGLTRGIEWCVELSCVCQLRWVGAATPRRRAARTDKDLLVGHGWRRRCGSGCGCRSGLHWLCKGV